LAKDRTPRRRPEAKTRKNLPNRPHGRWRLLLALLPIVLVAVATYAAMRSPWLTVQHVRVAGAQTLDERDVAALSGLGGESMLHLPLTEARNHILAIPQVRSASFHRAWPHDVTIRVIEREPAAFWAVGGRDYVVDADGVVLAAGAPSGPAPRIVEVDSNRVMGPGDRVHPDAVALARRVFNESPRFMNQGVKELEYRPGIGVTAVFASGMRVTFGDERAYDYKVATLSKLLEQLSPRGGPPRSVDLRFGERVTYE
jgi:cell division protein FtsQ